MPDENLERMDALQHLEMQIAAKLEPFGCEVEDWRFAGIMSILANQWRDPKAEPATPEKFVPKRKKQPQAEEPEEELTPEEIRERARAMLQTIAGPTGREEKPRPVVKVVRIAED